jgi:hypothetical protein
VEVLEIVEGAAVGARDERFAFLGRAYGCAPNLSGGGGAGLAEPDRLLDGHLTTASPARLPVAASRLVSTGVQSLYPHRHILHGRRPSCLEDRRCSFLSSPQPYQCHGCRPSPGSAVAGSPNHQRLPRPQGSTQFGVQSISFCLSGLSSRERRWVGIFFEICGWG